MTDPLDFAALTALVLAGLQGFGPWLRHALRDRARQVRSFGGGVGLGYIFLHLFPELDIAHEWLGRHVYLVILATFLAFYALEVWLHGRATRAVRVAEAPEAGAPKPPDLDAIFWLHIGIMAVYTAMIVFTLPETIATHAVLAIAGGIAIGLHTFYKDYVLRHEMGAEDVQAGRAILVVAPIVGWTAHAVLDPSEAVTDIFIAVLAGVLIQSVFRDELPRPDRAAFWWLVAGVVTYAGLSALS